jgi:HD-like signal output (HDOD) protein
MADDAFMAGLLHDIGKLVLALELPHAFGDALRHSREEGMPLVEAEKQEYGVTHAEVGAYLLGLWGLPYPIVEAVANHHEPRRVPQRGLDVLAAVHIADELIHAQGPEVLLRPGLQLDYLAELGLAEKLPDYTDVAIAQIKASHEENVAAGRETRRGA